jgi:MreB/Mrl family cell shape determining protein
VRPLKDGVIADFDTVEMMLHYFIRKVHMQRLMAPHPRVVIGIPSGVTEVEKRAAKDAALSAGAREAYTIEEPMAAAIGAGLPINEPIGSMIVDIGGGTTEVAVISLGGIVVNHSIRVAGDEIDDAIIQYARRDHNLVIGERTAENAKIAAGSAYPLEEEIRTTLRGRDLLTGLPKSVEVSSVELRDAISQPVNTIVWSGSAATDGAEDAGLPRRRSPHLCGSRHRSRRRGAAPLRAGSGEWLGDPPRAIAPQDRLSQTAGAGNRRGIVGCPAEPEERPRETPRHRRPHEVRF